MPESWPFPLPIGECDALREQASEWVRDLGDDGAVPQAARTRPRIL